MSIVNRVSLDEASWHASPAWAASQSAMEAEALSWFEANHDSLRADWDAENDAKPDTWDDDTWDDDTQPAPPTRPALDDPVSLALLSHLARKVPGDMSGLGLVVGLGTWQRFTGFSTSRMWLYLAELHARFTDPARARLDQAVAAGDKDAGERAADLLDLAERSLVAEVAAELSWSGLRAQGQVEVALILTSDLVKTLDAVAAGLVEVKKAEAIARALARESSELRTRVEGEVLPHAPGWAIPTLNQKIREAVLRLAPELAAARARWARKQRGVSFHAEPDDMVRMEAHIPVEDGIRVRAGLEHAAGILNANRMSGDDRGINEIRCDILTGVLSTLTATGPGSEQPGAEPTRERARRAKSGLRNEIVLTVPLETITGDAEHPGYLARYGPVSAGIARAMALNVARDGYWRCAVTDDAHGTLLGLGRSTFSPTYRAPEFLKRFTNLRDQTCDFPTCTTPAAACDFDHTVPWPEGTTCECGGGNRCGNHHRLKHETGWRVKSSANSDHPPGTVIWTSPMGRDHLRRPRSIGVPRHGRSDTDDASTSQQASRGQARRAADPWPTTRTCRNCSSRRSPPRRSPPRRCPSRRCPSRWSILTTAHRHPSDPPANGGRARRTMTSMQTETVTPETVTPETPRPVRRAVLGQSWHDLALLHWALPPETVAPFLPAGTVPDTIDGATYAGLIGFRMAHLGLPGFGIPYLGTFCETNVRLYSVDRQGRRAVVFLSLDAERLLPVITAQVALRLPYKWSRMRVDRSGDVLRYTTRRRAPGPRPATSAMAIRTGDPIAELTPLEHFLTARWGLHTRAWGRTLHLPNQHPRWPLHRAELLELDDSLFTAAGLPPQTRPPDSVLYSPGVQVVFGSPGQIEQHHVQPDQAVIGMVERLRHRGQNPKTQ